jgi:hypothetical protein
VNNGTWYISAPGKRDAWIFPMVLRSIFPQELPLLTAAAGLELIDRFGEPSPGAIRTGEPRSGMCVPGARLRRVYSAPREVPATLE